VCFFVFLFQYYFFLTSIDIERLQPALIRPGRVDVQVKMDLATEHQIETMFKKFFPNEETLCTQFLEKVPARSISMAQLQGHFLAHSGSATEAVDTINFSKKDAP
jgi:mitochondrial chaperone BCS1